MRTISVISVLILLLASGCLEREGSQTSGSSELTAKIISPKAGAVLSKGPVVMEASASGGRGPYTYEWWSSMNRFLGSGSKIKVDSSTLKKGEHLIVVKVRDSTGKEVQGSVIVDVI
ncbi:hypothetical protein [Methanothrix sp.]|uniref:hypothetical protein n=1 Tax=Methanothrix sp. TaxID=90426 RepID=UPI002B9CA818|nr:hypothetical protein [Methanothrix sp.]HOK58483.1 hypothetical protein [Methanothrix sp.]HOL43996.1 hypothetical protein [Methanothrix sp.]HPO88780.1 hypothetical protein [Methanothrix sp.]